MTKQEKLIKAIREAQEAGGYMQKQLATIAGTSAGNLCSVLNGNGSMSEEKWRLLCEGLALDYDVIVAEDKPQRFTLSEAPETTPPPVQEPVAHEQTVEEVQPVPVSIPLMRADLAREADVVAKYIAGKIREDLSKGTDMPLDDVYTILSWVKSLQREVMA